MIPPDLENLLRKHRSQGVVLDSSLLVLLIVGLVDPALILEARPTRNARFTGADFEFLRQMIARVAKLVTTPHILAETSNLLDQCKGTSRERVLSLFARHIQAKAMEESHVAAVEVLSFDCFTRLGLTDCGIIHLAHSRLLVLTVDAPLAVELKRRGIAAVNFNHVRPSLRGIA